MKELELDKKLIKQADDTRHTNRKYRELLKENRQLEAELEAVLQMQRKFKTHTIRPSKVRAGEATACIIASDWHIEETIKSGQVSGLNEYNLNIARNRAKIFFQNSLVLLNICKRDISIKNIVLALLGDFISGSIHDELMEGNSLLPADAIWEAQNLLASGIRFLLDNTDCHLTIPCCSGNHGRLTAKQRHSTEQGNSLERYMYLNLALHFKDEKRVTFIIPEGYHIYLDVYGMTVRFHHGHNIRYAGGVGGLSIPLNKAIAQWNKARKADLDVLGHWHQFRDFGNVIVNGSLIGFSAYALAIKADFEKPRQAFFLLDKKRGKTIVAPVLTE